jgi:hypothetical protein
MHQFYSGRRLILFFALIRKKTNGLFASIAHLNTIFTVFAFDLRCIPPSFAVPFGSPRLLFLTGQAAASKISRRHECLFPQKTPAQWPGVFGSIELR